MGSAATPTTTAQWIVKGTDGFDNLQLENSVEIPKLGDHDCLVQIDAVSLNFRDLIIPKGQYPFPITVPVVPCSDGAGSVISTGARVSRFSPGDKVCTLFNQAHLAGSLDRKALRTGLGGAVDGTLRQYGVFEESGLVSAPSNLSPVEASTLSCAPLTAWNALYGLRALKPGQVVLTQGTGGVSLSAMQFALAAGAIVIATTSSSAKADKLKKLGVHHVINYTLDPNWGATAKKLSPGELGVHHVIEVGGPNTMAQSLDALAIDGVVSVIGFLGGADADAQSKQPTMAEALQHLCTVRGILVGSRLQFEDMNRAIEANGIRPLVDEEGGVFGFDHAREAYEYMWSQKNFGKVVVKVH